MENAIPTLIIACILAVLIPALTLTSLIYKPMFENTHDRQDTSPWQQFWGGSYRPALKQRLLQPVFSQLERERKIGDVIVDVDFRKVLSGLAKYLKPEGRIIVFNFPDDGNRLLFSDLGLKDNRQLVSFFEEHNFEIEHKAFPKRAQNETDEAE